MTTATIPAPPASGPAGDPEGPAKPDKRPRWELPALAVLLAGTAVLYLWDLGASGWANSYYAAAAQAGSESWSAFFFGALDSAGSITVDKTPLAIWPMALSVRIFGLNSWSILVPQALLGVATVALLYRTVRQATGSPAAGLLASTTLALTPVAVLMFRFDNPDAMLVFLLVAAAAATQRAVAETLEEDPRPLRWLILGGGLVGLAFLAKMLQAFLVLPALAAAYLLCATAVPLGRRLLHLLAAFAATIAGAGWWLAIVELMPASARPYIGGSQSDSVLELALGYNGLGRLNGNEVGAVGDGGGGWGETGLLRLLDSSNGGQIAWLLPTALLLGAVALWLAYRGRPGNTVLRAGLVIWLGWLVVTGLTFSLMAGIFHEYYSVALAPAVAALVGIGATMLWQRRDETLPRAVLVAAIALTATLGFALLGRYDGYLPWLRYVVLASGLVAGAMLAGLPRLPRRAVAAIPVLGLLAALAGPAAFSATTAATPQTGSIVTAGPDSGRGGPGGFGGGGGLGMPPGATGQGAGAPPGLAGGGATGTGPQGTGGIPGQATGGPQGMGAGGVGGLLNGSEPTEELTTLLVEDADSYTWVAAVVGANSAAGYQLATELPVMALGGFNGSDPSPTLEQFQELVAAGEIHWFVEGGGGFGGGGRGPGGSQNGGSTASSEIAAWVAENFQPTEVDGVTLYDLSSQAGATS